MTIIWYKFLFTLNKIGSHSMELFVFFSMSYLLILNVYKEDCWTLWYSKLVDPLLVSWIMNLSPPIFRSVSILTVYKMVILYTHHYESYLTSHLVTHILFIHLFPVHGWILYEWLSSMCVCLPQHLSVLLLRCEGLESGSFKY